MISRNVLLSVFALSAFTSFGLAQAPGGKGEKHLAECERYAAKDPACKACAEACRECVKHCESEKKKPYRVTILRTHRKNFH